MKRLPMTVIGGYLGAGKTTLVNRLLTEDHGLRLMVLVNDFGAIDIDAALLAEAGGDTIALTNGCVCCTMGADLFLALGDALDRRPRPDHLIVEASGIADPAAIANAAIAEPELAYAGIVTVTDAHNVAALLDDALIGPQVAGQIRAADLVLLSKTARPDPALLARLRALSAPGAQPAPLLPVPDAPLAPLLLGAMPRRRRAPAAPAGHAAHVAWHHESACTLREGALTGFLAARPEGMYRLKGFLRTDAGGRVVQIVGRQVEIRPAPAAAGAHTRLVALGPAGRFAAAAAESWWRRAPAVPHAGEDAEGTRRGGSQRP